MIQLGNKMLNKSDNCVIILSNDVNMWGKEQCVQCVTLRYDMMAQY